MNWKKRMQKARDSKRRVRSNKGQMTSRQSIAGWSLIAVLAAFVSFTIFTWLGWFGLG